MTLLLSNPQTENPLYLRLLLEELLVHGDFFTLNDKIQSLASHTSIESLLQVCGNTLFTFLLHSLSPITIFFVSLVLGHIGAS